MPAVSFDVPIRRVWAGTMVALAVALIEGSATLAATTTTDCGVVTIGAWKSPPDEMLPVLTDQTTPVLLVFFTRAVNCNDASEDMLAPAGVTTT